MKLHFMSVLLCLASVLPNISCSKSENDPWTPGTPRIEWDEQGSMPLLEPTKKVVPVNAKIIFPGDIIRSMHVHTECTSEFKEDIENRGFDVFARNRNEFHIASLLPDHIWRQYDYSKLGKTVCSFKFRASNQVGSQWNFTVPGLEIANLSKLENFHYRPYDRDSFKGENVGYNLACEYFQNARRYSDNRMVGVLTREIADGEVANRYGPVEATDSRLRYPLQKCRLSIDRVGADGFPDRYVSQIFNSMFRLPKVEISAKISIPDSIPSAHANKTQVLEVTLANWSSVHTAFRLFDLKPNNLAVQLVLLRPSNIFRVEDQYTVTLNYEVENASRIIDEGTNRIIEIAPGQIAKIKGTLQSSRLCVDEVEGASLQGLQSDLARGGAGHIGYFYGFPAGRFMERLVNWNPERPDSKAPVLNTEIFAAQDFGQTGELYPGWAPLRGWTERRKGERPEISAVIKSSNLLCRSSANSPGAIGVMMGRR